MHTHNPRRIAVAFLTSSLFASPLLAGTGLQEEIAQARVAIEQCQQGSFDHQGDPECVRALDSFWALTQAWMSEYLDVHPRASAREIEADLAAFAKDADLVPSVVRLTSDAGDAVVVSIDWDFHGTVFAVSRTPSRPFTVTWDLPALAAKDSPDSKLAAWSAAVPGVHGGPLGGRVLALPPTRSGRPRFLIDAIEHAGMGLEVPGQISVWEWTGTEAKPEFIGGYLATGSPHATLQGDRVRIPTKERTRMFFTCGSCEEPMGTWTLRVTPDGVTDLGHAFAEPLLKLIDDLLDRVAHHQDASGLASSQARAYVAKILAEDRQEWRRIGVTDDPGLGMLMDWKVRVHGRHRVMDLSADFDTLRFTIGQRSGKPYVTAVTTLTPGS